MKRTHTHRRFGFTLVEMLVTLAIGTVMTALAIGNMRSFIKHGRVNSQAREVLNMINRARTLAVSQARPAGIYFGQANGLATAAAHPVTLPSGSHAVAMYIFVDNQTNPTSWNPTSALSFTPGALGDDDYNMPNVIGNSNGAMISDGPRYLPISQGGKAQDIVLIPCATGVTPSCGTVQSQLPNDGSGGFAIVFSAQGVPMQTNVNAQATAVSGVFPLTIGVDDTSDTSPPVLARYIVIQSSGTAQIL